MNEYEKFLSCFPLSGVHLSSVIRKPNMSWFSFGSWLKTRTEKSQLCLVFLIFIKKAKEKKQAFVTELRLFVRGRWHDMELNNFLNSCYGINIVA